MKAYLVLDLSVNDFSGFRKYIAEIPAFIAKHSGKYIVQGVQPTMIEGDWKPERLVIIEFPEREKAEAFLILLRHKRRRGDCRMQQGQRERFRAMATISLRRIVAIEF